MIPPNLENLRISMNVKACFAIKMSTPANGPGVRHVYRALRDHHAHLYCDLYGDVMMDDVQ